jgi:hypothetical protein
MGAAGRCGRIHQKLRGIRKLRRTRNGGETRVKCDSEITRGSKEPEQGREVRDKATTRVYMRVRPHRNETKSKKPRRTGPKNPETGEITSQVLRKGSEIA